jgi:parallel beta-helix repeat protein
MSPPPRGFRLDRGRIAQYCLSTTILVLLAGAPASARTWLVTDDGGGDAATIQAGIDSAAAGDTVLVGAGTYTGAGNCNIDFSGKAVTLRSESGPGVTTIDCGGTSSGISFLSGEDASSVVQGLEIRNALDSGIYCRQAAPTIRDCIVVEGVGHGVLCQAGGSPTIQGSTIAGNEGRGVLCQAECDPCLERCVITGNGGGIYLMDQCEPTLRECTISANAADRGAGIRGQFFTTATVERCIVWGNCATAAGNEILMEIACDQVTLTCCAVDSTGIEGAGTVTFDGPQCFGDPLFCDPESCANAPVNGGDYTLAANSPCLPDQSPCATLIGAGGEGCAAVAVDPSTWAEIKNRYRDAN